MMVKMMENHDAATAQSDMMFNTIAGRVDAHDDTLLRMSRKMGELNEQIDNLELSRCAQSMTDHHASRIEKDIAARMEAKMEERMAALEQEMRMTGPPVMPTTTSGTTSAAATSTDTDTVVIGGIHRDTPKQQI